MITAGEAALIAELLLEFPADHPEHGWELEEFSQGWLVNGRDWQEHRDQFAMVIERETGLVRYFTAPVQPWQVITDYQSVREHGRTDDRWPKPDVPRG